MTLPFQQGFMLPSRPKASIIGPSSVLWDTATKHADVALSGTDNLIATLGGAGGAYRTTRANTGIADGDRKFFEITVNVKGSTSAFAIGACLAAQSNTAYVGNAAGTGFSYAGGGNVNRNGSVTSDGGGYLVGQTVTVAVDYGVNKKAYWWSPSNGWRGLAGTTDDPATNAGGLDISAFTGTLFPAVSLFTLNDQVTANFGHSAFVNTAARDTLLAAGFTPLGS